MKMMMVWLPEPSTSAEETSAHVDFFMPVHLQKQSQLDSEQFGITAQLFLCKCFHLCTPTLLPCLFLFFSVDRHE